MTGYYSQRVFELERERTRLEARIDALVVERDLAQQGLAEAVAVIAAIYAKVRKYDSPLSSHLGPGMAVDALITLAERYGAALRAVRPVLGQVYRMIPGPEHAPQERDEVEQGTQVG